MAWAMWGFGRQVMGLICFCVCLGPILILVGVGLMIASASDPRGTSISMYNSVVSDWNNKYLPQFQAAKFYVQGSAGEWVPLVVDNSPDFINDVAQVQSYTALKYVSNMSVVVPPQPFNEDGPDQLFWFEENTTALSQQYQDIMMQNNLYPGDGSGNTLNCNDDEEDDYDDCANACYNMGGQWNIDMYDDGYCQVNQIISAFCMKVSQDSFGDWSPDTTYGGSGCYSQGLPQALYQSTNGVGTMYFGGNITIRHAQDPHIYLGQATNFKYSFGATQRQNFVTGWVLIITGGVVLLPMICLIIYLSKRHRHHHHHHSSETERIYVTTTVPAYPAYPGQQPTQPYGSVQASVQPYGIVQPQPYPYNNNQAGYTQYSPQQPSTRPY
eukprot:TRINITY_DN4006_c0_g1_i1.p1 TRINITY_DN4006_c0_g1~~TRINITY_DN4006_c0_g1_i1.p1  ORF type:complete len:398 (-),score=80.47 TRINITY_DN4006_c0_g1_i1:33-1181(-)